MTKLRLISATMATGAFLACAGGVAPASRDAGTDAGFTTEAVDAGPQLAPHAGIAQVAGGAAMSSRSYRLVVTTGQGSGDNSTLSSKHYVMVGGIVGATQAR